MSEAEQIVAIDGPVGTGKSSVAKEAARRLGFAFLDTGAMYRAATWRAVHHGLDLEDGEALVASTAAMKLDMEETEDGQVVMVDGVDVSAAIRRPDVTRLIYKLDQNPAVRRRLVALQQDFGERRPTVAEGRDIGTVVFPKAKCKIYMDAHVEARTARRAKQLLEKGIEVDLDALRNDIEERDYESMNRAVSPLRKAEDAVLLDTTELDFEAAVEQVVRLAREKL